MPDAEFDHPRLARVYDPLDPDRSDLDVYVDIAVALGAREVLDVGCGTGTLIARLAQLGIGALGVDPAAASIDIAREKVARGQAGVGAGQDARDGATSAEVTLIVGTALDAAADPAHHHRFDLATMTANVAQVFLEDADWWETLRSIHRCLRPGGLIAFESRRPSDRGWERWTKEATRRVVHVEGEGPVEEWVNVTNVDGEFVTFESPTIFHGDGERIDSVSTLRFRPQNAIETALLDAGFHTIEVKDLPFAPERAWLFVAQA